MNERFISLNQFFSNVKNGAKKIFKSQHLADPFNFFVRGFSLFAFGTEVDFDLSLSLFQLSSDDLSLFLLSLTSFHSRCHILDDLQNNFFQLIPRILKKNSN